MFHQNFAICMSVVLLPYRLLPLSSLSASIRRDWIHMRYFRSPLTLSQFRSSVSVSLICWLTSSNFISSSATASFLDSQSTPTGYDDRRLDASGGEDGAGEGTETGSSGMGAKNTGEQGAVLDRRWCGACGEKKHDEDGEGGEAERGDERAMPASAVGGRAEMPSRCF